MQQFDTLLVMPSQLEQGIVHYTDVYGHQYYGTIIGGSLFKELAVHAVSGGTVSFSHGNMAKYTVTTMG